MGTQTQIGPIQILLSCIWDHKGSVLGPILFTLYIVPLWDLCCNHRFTYHLYVDYQQVSFHPSVVGVDDHCFSQLEVFIEDITQWMSSNMLKLNDDKTEFILLGTRQQLAKMNAICIGDTSVSLVNCIHNLSFFMEISSKRPIMLISWCLNCSTHWLVLLGFMANWTLKQQKP